MSLTKPQRELLETAVRDGFASCVESYAPSRKLVALGLVTPRPTSFGFHRIIPTDAGRAALSAAGQPEGGEA